MSRNFNAKADGKRFISRVFAAGFIFFLAKGLLWLALGGLALIGIL